MPPRFFSIADKSSRQCSAVWFKIDQYGKVDGKWAAADKLTADSGVWSVKIPEDLLPGQYILRNEMWVVHFCTPCSFSLTTNLNSIDLHSGKHSSDIIGLLIIEANLHSAAQYPGIQFFPSCAQLEVTGSGTAYPSEFVSIPGVYTPETPGELFFSVPMDELVSQIDRRNRLGRRRCAH